MVRDEGTYIGVGVSLLTDFESNKKNKEKSHRKYAVPEYIVAPNLNFSAVISSVTLAFRVSYQPEGRIRNKRA